jgi:K+-transporting ATPase KdpF subunit
VRQGRVKTCQGGVTGTVVTAARVCGEGMWEDIAAVVVGLALVAYLLYALVRPDRF